MAGIRSSRQGSSDKPEEFSKFTKLLDRLLSVPHDKIKAEMDAEKRAPKRKRAASGRAFSDKD
jgi:hypothetical protein